MVLVTLAKFLDRFRGELKRSGLWAHNQSSWDDFARCIHDTLDDVNGAYWYHREHAALVAWRALDIEGPLTMEALRKLPRE